MHEMETKAKDNGVADISCLNLSSTVPPPLPPPSLMIQPPTPRASTPRAWGKQSREFAAPRSSDQVVAISPMGFSAGHADHDDLEATSSASFDEQSCIELSGPLSFKTSKCLDGPQKQAWNMTSSVKITSLVQKAKRKFTFEASAGNAVEERLAEQRYRKQNAVILLQKTFRGHSGRIKATLALEMASFSNPLLMKPGMVWYRRGVKALVYMMIAFLIVFALYLNLIFGIKFDKEQQIAWTKGFIASLSFDLGIGIPIQIFLLRALPHEIIKAILVLAAAVLSVYVLNGLAESELIDMGWFEDNVRDTLIVIFHQ